jgi:hypothetical protein
MLILLGIVLVSFSLRIVHGDDAKLTDAERFNLMALRDDAHAADANAARAVSQCGNAVLREIQETQSKAQTTIKVFNDALADAQKRVGASCKLDDKFQCANSGAGNSDIGNKGVENKSVENKSVENKSVEKDVKP